MTSLTPALAAEYERRWASCVVDFEPEKVQSTARRLLSVKDTCSGFFSVPWWFIALCWLRECSLNPRGVLHNGELIVGTGRKTRLVPAGRGPFSTWAEATKDALAYQGLDKVSDWSVAKTLYRLEGYNGYGYLNKGKPSPYLWSHTNLYADNLSDVQKGEPRGGKYVADHEYDPDVFDPQIGVCAVLKTMMQLDPTIAFGVVPADVPAPAPAPAPAPVPVPTPTPQVQKQSLLVVILTALLKLLFGKK